MCLKQTSADYHTECLKELFGVPRPPSMNLGQYSLEESISRQSEHISISGVQQKLIVDLTPAGDELVTNDRGRFILKPQTKGYRHLPENEHVSMQIGARAGVLTAANGLVAMPDGSLAYVVKRFDRTSGNPSRKFRQEDFCSLLGLDPSDKYEASAEQCAEAVSRYVTQPADSLLRLFRLFVFSYWISNVDLHLKNLSLLEGSDSNLALSPAYDLLCIRLYPQLKQGVEALSLNKKRHQLNRSDFLEFADACSLSKTRAGDTIDETLSRQKEAEQMIASCYLSREQQTEFIKWLRRKQTFLSRPK
jgi:serine/threonine-protein kinase HipA